MTTILGIETSCDETAAAIVTSSKAILANRIYSQKEHNQYGGVVPEIAARAHSHILDQLIEDAMQQAHVTAFHDLDAVAVTAGPGLIGGVMVGVMMAKGIASAARIPILAINHLEAHALTIRLVEEIDFPFLLALLSGGHCQILSVEGLGQYQRLGGTIDDALGEAFDKVAKMLGLGYPGGPLVEKHARLGNPARFVFPKPLYGRPGCDFSFSGLKTAVKRQVDALQPLTGKDIADICASFHHCILAILTNRLQTALTMFSSRHPHAKHLVLAGGVAANHYIRTSLSELCSHHSFQLHTPPVALCTDNAAMIAWAGIERFQHNLVDDLSFKPRANWPLA